MVAIFVNEGASIDYTSPVDRSVGEVVSVVTPEGDGFIGVVPCAIKAGSKGALAVVGVFELPKANESLVAGQRVFWDPVRQKIVKSLSLLGCVGNPVVNGDFSQGSAHWTNWTERGSGARDFASADVPRWGQAPGLRITASEDFNGGVYQALTLIPDQAYSLRILSRDLASTGDAAWAEVLIGTAAPVNGQDYTDGSPVGTHLLAKWDTFLCPRWNGTQAAALVAQPLWFIATAPTMYLVLKAGQDGNESSTVDVSFDDVALCQEPAEPAVLAPIGVVVAHAASADGTALVRLSS